MHVQPEPSTADPGSIGRIPGPGEDRTLPRARRALSRDTLLFGLGAFAGKVVGFLTLPIFTRLLSPDDFGRLDVLNALASSGILILMLGTDVAAVRLFFDRPSSDRRELLASWYALATLVLIPPSLGLIVAGSVLSQFLFGTTALGVAVSLVGVTLIAGTLHFVALGVLRASGRPVAYSLLEGGALAVNALLAVVLLLVWRADATAVMFALAVSWSLGALVGLLLVWRSVSVRPSTAAITALLRLGLPLTPAVAATWGVDFFHRAYLLGSAGATQAGYLSVAVRFASVAMLVVTAVQIAWHPHVYRRGDTAKSLSRIGAEARLISVVLAFTIGALGLVAPEAVGLVGGDRYAGAVPVVGLSLIGVLGLGLFVVGSIPSALARATKDLAGAVVTGVAAAAMLTIILAPEFGAIGTSAAIAAGQFISAGVAVWLGRRRYDVPVAWVPIVTIVALTSIVVLLVTMSAGLPLFARFGIGAVFLAALAIEGTVPAILADVLRRRGSWKLRAP